MKVLDLKFEFEIQHAIGTDIYLGCSGEIVGLVRDS